LEASGGVSGREGGRGREGERGEGGRKIKPLISIIAFIQADLYSHFQLQIKRNAFLKVR